MIRSGARRLLSIVAVLLIVAAAAALLGVATGAAVGRSLALGCYVVGALAGFVGFALGSRRLFRGGRRNNGGQAAEDADDSRAVAALLMVSGVLLVLLGVVIDPGAQLV